jgi:hypothetical protein
MLGRRWVEHGVGKQKTTEKTLGKGNIRDLWVTGMNYHRACTRVKIGNTGITTRVKLQSNRKWRDNGGGERRSKQTENHGRTGRFRTRNAEETEANRKVRMLVGNLEGSGWRIERIERTIVPKNRQNVSRSSHRTTVKMSQENGRIRLKWIGTEILVEMGSIGFEGRENRVESV